MLHTPHRLAVLATRLTWLHTRSPSAFDPCGAHPRTTTLWPCARAPARPGGDGVPVWEKAGERARAQVGLRAGDAKGWLTERGVRAPVDMAPCPHRAPSKHAPPRTPYGGPPTTPCVLTARGNHGKELQAKALPANTPLVWCGEPAPRPHTRTEVVPQLLPHTTTFRTNAPHPPPAPRPDHGQRMCACACASGTGMPPVMGTCRSMVAGIGGPMTHEATAYHQQNFAIAPSA